MNSNNQSGFDTKKGVLDVARGQLAKAIEASRAGRISPKQMERVRGKLVLDVANVAMRDIDNPPDGMMARLDLFKALIDAGTQVLDAWEAGDLAAAVRALDEAVTNAKKGV